MAGPWEDYQASDGPWTQYQSAPVANPASGAPRLKAPGNQSKSYKVTLSGGQAVDVGADSPTQARAQAEAWRAGNPTPGEAMGGDPTGGKSRTLMDSYTFGLMDELQGGLAAAKTGVQNLIGRGPGYSAKEAYNATTTDARQRLADFKQEHPKEAFGINLAGAVLNPTNVIGGEFVRGAQGGRAVARAAVASGAIGTAAGAGAGTDLASRAKGAVIGGAIGAGSGAALQGAGNALVARAARRAAAPPTAARQLSQAGVQLTPGQMIGGTARRVEDAMTSLPFTGAAINGARRRGIESFDRAAINQTLAPIGAQLPRGANVGRDGVRAAETAISDSYTQALAPVQQLAPDNQYITELTQVAQTPHLPAAVQGELDSVMADLNTQWGGPMNGQRWKEIDSQLSSAVRAADNASQNQPSARLLRESLQNLRTAHQGLLDRANPQAAAAVRNADLATANLARVRQASQYVGTSAREGVFTAGDLNRAVQGLDTSAGNRQFARGDALLQGLSETGTQVLPSTVPDSGTALRGMIGLGAYGGANMVAPGLALKGAVLDAGMASLYSPPVQALVNQIYRASTPGQASAALGQLATLAARNPGLAPLYNELRAKLSGPASDRAGSIPMQVPATQP